MSTATFLQSDSTTNGTWYNGTTTVYGADGYGIIGNAGSGDNNTIPVTQGFFNYPAYATVVLAGESAFCFLHSTTDARGLEYAPPGASTGTDANRIEAVWFQNPDFTIDIQDGGLHQIALYFWDGGNAGRVQTITITDDNNGNAVLDTRTISSFFTNGIWLVWTVSGKVTFTITFSAGPNAVVNGIFFDPAPATPAVFPPLVSRPRFEPAFYE